MCIRDSSKAIGILRSEHLDMFDAMGNGGRRRSGKGRVRFEGFKNVDKLPVGKIPHRMHHYRQAGMMRLVDVMGQEFKICQGHAALSIQIRVDQPGSSSTHSAVGKKFDMPVAQTVVAEPRTQAQTDDVVQVVPGDGHPAAKIKATIMVELLKSLKCAGAVFVPHQADVVNAGDSPAVKGPGSVFKCFHHLIFIRRGNSLSHEIDGQFP